MLLSPNKLPMDNMMKYGTIVGKDEGNFLMEGMMVFILVDGVANADIRSWNSNRKNYWKQGDEEVGERRG